MKRLSENNSGLTKKSAVVVVFLLAVVGVFELLPAVDHARAVFPADWREGQSCYDVLGARPWYGQVNPWIWFWFIAAPVMIFSVKPAAPAWQRAGRVIFVIALSYAAINLGTHLSMDIRNAPFQTSEITSSSSDVDRFKFQCYDIADGAKYIAALIFGWLPAMIYAGWWDIVWRQYHKRVTGLVGKDFKRDWISIIVVFMSVACPFLFVAALLRDYVMS